MLFDLQLDVFQFAFLIEDGKKVEIIPKPMIMIDMRLKYTSIFLNTFLILETNPTFIFLFLFLPQSIRNIDNHRMNNQNRTKHHNNQIDSKHYLNPMIMHILVAKIDMLMHIILKMANPHIIIMIKTKIR